MAEPQHSRGLFAALLKHWRGQHGLSQLDLALHADVSARHISFLETGRSQPSREMVLQLATTLSVPLRHQNEMLQAAGFDAEFEAPSIHSGMPDNLRFALERLKAQQSPFPLTILDRLYNLVDMNEPAAGLLGSIAPNAASPGEPINTLLAVFDPQLWQPAIANFDEVGRALLWRAKRESLSQPADRELAELVATIERMPTVPPTWRQIDLGHASEPTLVVRVAHGDIRLAFFTMMTAFSAPQNVTVEELRIESYFPADTATAKTCEALFGNA